ncbi:MAG: hypothetical protein WEC59_00360 [Salibacteraceae bacterium]
MKFIVAKQGDSDWEGKDPSSSNNLGVKLSVWQDRFPYSLPRRSIDSHRQILIAMIKAADEAYYRFSV